MTDIVERLRICAKFDSDQADAADEIERLREVLTGLYKSVNEWPVEVGGDIDLALRAAKAVLGESDD